MGDEYIYRPDGCVVRVVEVANGVVTVTVIDEGTDPTYTRGASFPMKTTSLGWKRTKHAKTALPTFTAGQSVQIQDLASRDRRWLSVTYVGPSGNGWHLVCGPWGHRRVPPRRIRTKPEDG